MSGGRDFLNQFILAISLPAGLIGAMPANQHDAGPRSIGSIR